VDRIGKKAAKAPTPVSYIGMDSPKRPSQHIQESRSMRAFSGRLPDAWILRHVTERDYGLDCLVEIPIGDHVVGHIFGAQLKDAKSIDWRNDNRATLSGIASATANYWMGLPFPVFLFLYVENEDCMFIANVRQQCRQRYTTMLRDKTTHFTFHRDVHLDNEDAELLLVALFFREQSFEDFSASLRNLLVYMETHIEFIEAHFQCDSFIEVTPDALLAFVAFYNSLHIVSDYVGVVFDVPSPNDLLEQDRNDFGHSDILLHEQTLAAGLFKLASVYCRVLRAAKRRVAGDELAFWLSRDSLLANHCVNADSEARVKAVQSRLASLGVRGSLE
jgi:uncharacterized protein DUF4365